MPRRPAKITQADIARAIRAAKEAGARAVTIDGGDLIRIALAGAAPIEASNSLHQEWTPSEALQRFLKRTEAGEAHLIQLMRSHRIVLDALQAERPLAR